MPKLAALMDDAEPDLLAYMGFAAAHRVKLHSTNPLECLNGENKRRTEVVGVFPNEAAITRLVGAILLEQNGEWTVRCSRYITRESIAPISGDPLVSLPTLAACFSRPKPVIVVAFSELHHARGHDPALPSQQDVQPPVAVSHPGGGEPLQPQFQRCRSLAQPRQTGLH